MPTYNGESIVHTLAAAVAADPKVKAQIWDRSLQAGAAEVDDFNAMEGPEGSNKAFITRRSPTGRAGDIINITVSSNPRGPGVKGEEALTGKESKITYKTYPVRAELWRDAVTFTEKQVDGMAVDDVMRKGIKAVREKLGRRRMNDMKLMLKLKGNLNTIYPNTRKTFASLTGLDAMSPGLLTKAKPIWKRNGGKPFEIQYTKNGSPVSVPLVYMSSVGANGMRNSLSYIQAVEQAAAKGDINPRFTGKLTMWQGTGMFEHETVDSVNDVLGDPLEPRAALGTAFDVEDALSDCKLIQMASDENTLFFEYFAGYRKEWYEGQYSDSTETAFYSAIAATQGFAWLVNPDDTYGFVRWTGNANTGNVIQLDKILSPDGAGTSTIGSTTVGNLDCTGDSWDRTAALGGVGSGNTFDDKYYTDSFQANAAIIPCNANGVPDTSALMLGVGSAVRYYIGSERAISKTDDYGMVNGSGYKCTFGQAPCIDTTGRTNGYSLLRFAGQHEGLEVPCLNA